MHTSLPRGLVLATLLALSSACLFATDAKTKAKTLIDFTKRDVEFDGGSPKPVNKYDYSYEAWDGKLVFLEGKGVLIPALPGNGGMGRDAGLTFGASTAGEIAIAVGNRNEAESFTVSMVDTDGTEVSWYLSLQDKPRGLPISYPLPLDQPSKEEKPGKKPGFNMAKIKTWQIKGNWQPAKLEIILIRLTALPPAAP